MVKKLKQKTRQIKVKILYSTSPLFLQLSVSTISYNSRITLSKFENKSPQNQQLFFIVGYRIIQLLQQYDSPFFINLLIIVHTPNSFYILVWFYKLGNKCIFYHKYRMVDKLKVPDIQYIDE